MTETTQIDLKSLNSFLKRNSSVNFRTANLLNNASLQTYKWGKQNQQQLLPQLKAYQRMLRVVPEGETSLAKALLKQGFSSALQIANMPKQAFIAEVLETLKRDQSVAESIYVRAIAMKKAITLQYVAQAQQREPHTRTAGFVR